MISSSVQRSNFCTSAAAQTQQGIVVATAKERKGSQAPSSWKDVFFLTFKPDFRSAPIILSKPSLDFWWSKMSIGRPKNYNSVPQGHVSAPAWTQTGRVAAAELKLLDKENQGRQRCRGQRSTSADWAGWRRAEESGTCSRWSCTSVSIPGSPEGLTCSIWLSKCVF